MKKKIFYIAGTLVVLLAAIFSFYFFRDDDKKQLRRNLDELCEIISKSTGENPAVSGLKANRADKVFAHRCHVKIGRFFTDGSYTPTEIGANIMRFKGAFKWIKVSYSDLEFAISTVPGTRNAASAKIFFTGSCTGSLKNANPDRVDEIRDVEILAEKGEKGWRFKSIVITKILQK